MTLAGLMVAIWRDARSHTNQGLAYLRAEIREGFAQVRADTQTIREEVHAGIAQVHADNQSLRGEVRNDIQVTRREVRADLAEVKTDVSGVREDVQSLTERQSRTEGVIQGHFTRRTDPDRRNDAA